MITSKKVFRPCVHGAVRQIERWLSRQAADGWNYLRLLPRAGIYPEHISKIYLFAIDISGKV